MTAERTRHDDRTPRRGDDELAVLDREQLTGTGDEEIEPGDVEDGDTVAEDSGAGSFLDRFVPSRRPR